MARLQAKSLDNPDEVRPTPFGRVDIYNLDDLVIGRMVFEPGWHWMEHVQPIAGTSLCQYHHVGICISGRLGNRLEDGTTNEIGPGMVYEIPPGHDGWVVGDEPFVAYDVAGVRSFARVDENTQRVLGAVLFTDIVDFDRPRGVARPGALAGAGRGAQRAHPVRARPLPGPAREDDGRRRAGPLRRLRAGGPRGGGDLPGGEVAGARRSGRGSTRARSRSPPATSAAWRSTSPRASWPSPARARSTCRPRPGSSSPTRG